MEKLSKEYGKWLGLKVGDAVETKNLILFGIYRELKRYNDEVRTRADEAKAWKRKPRYGSGGVGHDSP